MDQADVVNASDIDHVDAHRDQGIQYTSDIDQSGDQSNQGLQNTGVQEAIDSLDEVTKVMPEESIETSDSRGIIVGDVKPLLPEELDKIANCLVELKSALETAPAAIVECQLCYYGYM